MIRPFTVVCMLMAVGSGLYLYQCKHQAQVLDRRIATTLRETEAARNRIGMLRAEWAQLNEPERIAELARAHSALQTAKPTQFIAANDLAGKLPAPVMPTQQLQSTDVPEDTEAAPPVARAEPPAPAPRVAVAAPEAKPEPRSVPRAPVAAEPKPVQTATQTPASEPKPTHRPPAPVAAPQVAAVHPVARAAPARTVALSTQGDSEATAPGTVGAAVLRAMRAREASRSTPSAAPYVQPVAAATRSYVPPPVAPSYAPPTYAPPTYAPQAYAAPVTGSMLGGARGSLPPPVPFAAR